MLGGKLFNDSAGTDCCCTECGNCDNCADGTPCKVLLSFTGITLCAGCLPIGAVFMKWRAGTDLNQTLCLIQQSIINPVSGSACRWIGAMPILLDVYFPDCDTFDFTITSAVVTLAKFIVGGINSWSVEVDVPGTVVLFNSGNPSTTVTPNCLENFTIPNTTICGVGEVMAENGIASGTPNGC